MCTSKFEKCNLKLVILLSGFSLESRTFFVCLFLILIFGLHPQRLWVWEHFLFVCFWYWFLCCTPRDSEWWHLDMASAITHFTELSDDFNYTTNMEALVRTSSQLLPSARSVKRLQGIMFIKYLAYTQHRLCAQICCFFPLLSLLFFLLLYNIMYKLKQAFHLGLVENFATGLLNNFFF